MPLDLKIIRKWVAEQDSTAEAARRLGMQPPNLFRLLSGNANIRMSTLEHIAGVMRVEPQALIRGAVLKTERRQDAK